MIDGDEYAMRYAEVAHDKAECIAAVFWRYRCCDCDKHFNVGRSCCGGDSDYDRHYTPHTILEGGGDCPTAGKTGCTGYLTSDPVADIKDTKPLELELESNDPEETESDADADADADAKKPKPKQPKANTKTKTKTKTKAKVKAKPVDTDSDSDSDLDLGSTDDDKPIRPIRPKNRGAKRKRVQSKANEAKKKKTTAS